MADQRLPEFPFGLGYDPVKLRRDNVFMIKGAGGDRILKELRIGAEQAKLIAELLTYLNGSGLTPKLIRTETGAAYFWIKGNRYLLTSYLPGRSADYHKVGDLQAAIRAMAEFHRLSGEFLKSRLLSCSVLKFEPGPIWRKRLREMEICRDRAIRLRDNWSREYLRFWRLFWNQAIKAIEEIESPGPKQPKVICYHDWAFHNLIIHNERAALIDFDYIIADQPVHDRANLISRYLRLNWWSHDALLKALWNFDRFYPWKSGELRELRIYLMFPYEYWILGREYFLERQPWSKKYYREQWKRKVAGFEQRVKILELIECLE